MFSWNVGYWGESLVSASTKRKPQTRCPYRCTQLLPVLYPALLCREVLTSQVSGFGFLWDTRVEAGHSSKVVSILHQSSALVEALHRSVWTIGISFLPLTISSPVMLRLQGRCSTLLSTPKCSTPSMCHKVSTCFYSFFGCCNWGIERLVLSEATWNLSDQAEPYYWRGGSFHVSTEMK